MQQDLEDEKNEATIKDLESKVKNYEAALKEKDSIVQDLKIKVKDHEAALEKKDFVIQSMEGSLAEAQAENNRLNNELLKRSEKSEQEKKNLETSLKTEIEKNLNLQKSLKELQEKCLNFGSRCVQRLKDVFHSIGASSDTFTPSAENLPSTLEHIEGEVDNLCNIIVEKTNVNLCIPCNISFLFYLCTICFVANETLLLSRRRKTPSLLFVHNEA
jgi:chromosome segregation ATPase